MFLKSFVFILFIIINLSKCDDEYEKRKKSFENAMDLAYPKQTIIGFGIANNKFYIFLNTLWLYIGNYDDIDINNSDEVNIKIRQSSIEKMIDLTQKSDFKNALCPKDPHCDTTSANVFLYHNKQYKDNGFSFAVLKKSYKHDTFKTFDGKTFKYITTVKGPTAMPINLIINGNTTNSLSFINKLDKDSYYWVEKQEELPLVDR